MGLELVEAGRHIPDDINVIIEIPSHADPVKYEVDKKTGVVMVDRFVATCMHYPCDYGFVPKTELELACWDVIKNKYFQQAVEIFLRFLHGEKIASSDLSTIYLQAKDFKRYISLVTTTY